jgi:hypothetical protein
MGWGVGRGWGVSFYRVLAWIQFVMGVLLLIGGAPSHAAHAVATGCFFLLLDLGDKLEERR